MAAELAADLEEGTPEDVLAGDAEDAVSFARAWAAERGVIPRRRTLRVPATLALIALAPTLLGAALTIDASRPDSLLLPLVQVGPPSVRIAQAPSPVSQTVILAQAARDRAAVAKEPIRLAPVDDDSSTLGNALLIIGLAILVPTTLLWSGRVALNR
jgi:hypothetical protein